MDFLDPVKKRAHTRRLFIGYFLMGIAIVLASIILVIVSYGYDVDRKTGEVIQNGLIFANAGPEPATIYLNGKENGQTDKRLTIPAGDYSVEYRRKGYRSWKKQVQLEGSSIERLVYARLFPEKLEQAETITFDAAPAFASQSPDRRWLVTSQGANLQAYQVFDTANPEEPAVSLTLPAGVLTTPTTPAANKLELVEWASDNRHILVEHSFDEKTEFIVIDREKVAESFNVNKLLSTDPSELTLRDKKFDQFYVYSAADLTLSQINSKTKESVLVGSGITSYKTYQSDIVVYATKEEAKPGKTVVKIWDDGRIRTINTFTETEVLMDLARFDGQWYFAIVPVNEGRLHIYKDLFNRLKDNKTVVAPFTVMRIANPQYLSFSANTRFIAVQAGSKFATYDLEMNRRYNFTIPGEIDAGQKARWMDGHRLVLTQAGKVTLFEFDGTNRQELSASLPSFLPYFDRDYERLFTISPAKADSTKAALTRTSLKLDVEP